MARLLKNWSVLTPPRLLELPPNLLFELLPNLLRVPNGRLPNLFCPGNRVLNGWKPI